MYKLMNGSERGTVSERCNAERVVDCKATAAQKREAGAAAPLQSAGDVKRDDVCGAQRLHLADDAQGVSALAAGLLLFCEVAELGRVAATQRRAARSRAGQSG